MVSRSKIESGVTALAETVHIDLAAPDAGEEDGRQTSVLLDGNDVTWTIRTPIVDKHVSPVAAYAGVRAALTVQQRRIAQRYGRGDADKPGIVLVGRDTGTVVAPDAAVKIYMDASADERARRRHVELAGRGQVVAFENVLRDIVRRDEIDSHRAFAPLRAADDAVHRRHDGDVAAGGGGGGRGGHRPENGGAGVLTREAAA